MSAPEIRNAVIVDARIYFDRGMLTAWLDLDYGSSVQGFGGFALWTPSAMRAVKPTAHAGQFLARCIQVADAESWGRIVGRTVRASCSHERVEAIGHIVKEDWFNPQNDFYGK